MARIYVSSTFSDLKEYRDQVNKSLVRLGHTNAAMEYYVAGDERPLDRCLADVAACDLYVGIFAWRYGFVPQENNPDRRSITELEYRKALEKKIPCLIFLLHEDAPWPKSKQDKGATAEQIERLRQELSDRHSADFFEGTDELTRKINEAVVKWEKESGQTGQRQLTDWDAYRQALINKHQWVPLQVIAGVSKERGVMRIPLLNVFEPQLASTGAPISEVPDEIRQYHAQIYGVRAPMATEDEPDPTLESNDNADTNVSEVSEEEAEESLFVGDMELVLDLLCRKRMQVILGGPGSGKSTLLHYIMLRLCTGNGSADSLPPHLQETPLPFLVVLRNYVLQKSPDFISYLVQNSQQFYGATLHTESLQQLLQAEKRAVVFFDGLDEIFDPDDRSRVLDQFETFARQTNANIVVTSRIAGYNKSALSLADFEHYTLLPFTLTQIRNFAPKWYQYYSLEGTERTAQGLVQRIIDNPRLLDLAGNPLLLTMMAVIYKDRDLPNERWRLYERCAETMLEDWDLIAHNLNEDDFNLLVYIRTQQKSEILQRVALAMLQHHQTGKELNAIAYQPLLKLVAEYLKEKYQRSPGDAEAIAVDILRHLRERTYVLAETGERIFGFVHRTFMEYFAACRCKAEFNSRNADFDWLRRDIFGTQWQRSEWEEVLPLLIAMLHDQCTLIHPVIVHLLTECKMYIPYHLAFAARCLGEAGDLQDAAQGEELLTLLASAIADFAPQTRKSEAQAFVEKAIKAFALLAPLIQQPTAAVQAAIERLNQVQSIPARMAAWQMGFALRTPKERLAYALSALTDGKESVRRGAIAVLEREWPGRADIAQQLAAMVQNDRQARVRQAALAALQRSWRAEPAILDAIASRIDEETSYTHVIKLINYLATIWRGSLAARDLIMQLAAHKPKARSEYDYRSVSNASGQALGRGWRDDPATLPWLRERAAQDSDENVRRTAISAIIEGWLDAPATLPMLRERATQDSDWDVRWRAISGIIKGWCDDSATLPLLRERATQDGDENVRGIAISAIAEGWSDDPATLPWLRERATQDSDENVRSTAISAISEGWRDDPATLPWLRERATQDSQENVRGTAISTISEGWRDNPETLPWLRERATQDSNRSVRWKAISAISKGWSDDPATLPWLCERATQDRNGSVRWRAISAISKGWRDDPATLPWLRERAIQDSDETVRRTAISAIIEGWRDDPATLPWLCERATQDNVSDVRRWAIWAIIKGWRDDPATLHWLCVRATQDSDETVRRTAISAISEGWSDDPATLPWLRERAMQDSDENVRRTAISTIIEGWRDDPVTLPWLRERAIQDSAWDVRWTAISAIKRGWSNNPEVQSWLQQQGFGT